MLFRLVMKSFRSGCVNRYADVDADTPERTPSRSAALQLGGLAPGSWLAWASGAAPKSAAPISAVLQVAGVSPRANGMAHSLRPRPGPPRASQGVPQGIGWGLCG